VLAINDLKVKVLLDLKFYVNNPLEDITPPELIEESFRVDVETIQLHGRDVFFVDVSFEMIEENVLTWNTAHIYINAIDDASYSFQSWGYFDEVTNRAHIEFYFTQFYPNGYYDFAQLMMFDLGGNLTRLDLHLVEGFNDLHKFLLDTETPDSTPPEIDVNRITVSARPTNPDAPNGETLVTIKYFARDDLSGLGVVSYVLRDPLGTDFYEYHYHDQFYNMFFEAGDPYEWREYTINVTLPVGSAPGIWGLLEIYVMDKAGNFHTYNFSETVIFQPFD
jgi:hypothetical protein